MATTTATKKKAEVITIPALELKTFQLKIVGDTPLICHAWSEKARKMMADKEQHKPQQAKEAKRPIKECAETLYWMDGKPDYDNMTDDEIRDALRAGRFGFPVLAFKAAAIDGGYASKVLDKKTSGRAAFQILGEQVTISYPSLGCDVTTCLTEIEGEVRMRAEPVPVGMGAEMRYRAEFPQWSTMLTIRYNKGVMSMEQIVNLFNVGGFSAGVGDWRPQRDGMNGCFHVE